MKLAIDIFGCTMEILMLFYFYKKLLKEARVNDKILFSIYMISGFITLFVATFITKVYMRTVCSILFIILPIFFYKGKILYKIVLVIIFLSVQTLSEILTKMISLGIYGDYLTLQANFLQNYLHGMIFSKILALLIIIMITSIVQIRININYVPLHFYIILFIIPVATMFSVHKLRDIQYVINTQNNYIAITLTVILLIFLNLILFYFFDKMAELGFLKTRIAISELLIADQKTYYEKLTRQQEEIRSLSHDMRNHLLVLEGYIADNDLETSHYYIQNLQKQITNNKPIITGYSVLDMVIASKKDSAMKQDTIFEITFFIITELTIDITDVAIIVANCLDNALEATAKIVDSSNRHILLDMKTKGNYLLLKISNTVAEKVEIINNKIPTSKSDRLHHGFGLKNIEKIAEEHDGSLRLKCDDNLFITDIMLRLDDPILEKRF